MKVLRGRHGEKRYIDPYGLPGHITVSDGVGAVHNPCVEPLRQEQSLALHAVKAARRELVFSEAFRQRLGDVAGHHGGETIGE